MKYAVSEGIINLDDVRESMENKERKRLLSKHKYKIFEDKDGRWKTTLPDETKKNGRKLIAKKSLVDLEDFLIEHYAEEEDVKYIQNTLYTLKTIFPEWLEYKNSHTNASSYMKRIKVDWNKYYLPDVDFINMLIKDLDFLKLDKWAHELVKKHNLTKKQYFNITIIIRQCLDYAVDLGIIEINQYERVKIKGNMFHREEKRKSETQVFIEDEQECLMKEIKRRIDARPWCTTPLMVLLNFQLGLRIGELCSIKWTDIEDNYIHIQRMETTTFTLDKNANISPNGYEVVNYTKSEAGDRQVYVNHVAKSILKQIRMTNMKYGYYDNNFIYIKSRYKTRGTSRSYTKYLETLCSSIGILQKSNHKIRKTYISSLFDCGINYNTIREQAGHEDEKTSLNNYCFDQKTKNHLETQLEKATNHLVSISI